MTTDNIIKYIAAEPVYNGDIGPVPHGALFEAWCFTCKARRIARREQPGGLTTCPRCGEQI